MRGILGLAKLIYSTSLLSIPKHLIDSINKIIFDFIWDGKTAKIKRKTIIAEKRHGGLKMIDFEIMERSLKIAWIKRIIDSEDAAWKVIPNYATCQYGGLQFLVKCDYNIKSLNLEYLPEFYHKVLNYWHDSKLLTANKEKSVKNQIIWNNQNIVVDGKPIFFRNWVNKGIVYIDDLLDEDSNFLSLIGLKDKFQINPPFTVYYGLLKAIPKEWKTALHNAPHTGNSTQITLSTKSSYLKLLSKRYLAPTAEQKIINHGFTKENVCNVYLLPFQIFKEAKLIMFQYKIIHNILPTQASLFRSNLAENDVCPLCNLESQSLSHMLFSCTVSSSLWNLFTRWWQKTFGHHISLTETIILYGWHQEPGSNTWIALNYSLIIAKYHIFATSVRGGILDFENFLFRLKDKLSTLQAVATKNNKLDKFKETWSALV